MEILIVEDNPGDVRLIREALRDAPASLGGDQLRVSSVERLSQAISALAERPADVVLLDLSLPDCQGLATVRRFVTAAPEAPFLVLTGLDDEELAVSAVQQGAQDYLVKGSMGGATLMQAIRYAIERKRAELARSESERLALATLNSLTAHIAILDGAGRIVAVNEAWRRFAAENGGLAERVGEGTSYLQTCERANLAEAAQAAAGIRAVIAGELPVFSLEYACHPPGGQRWFTMRVTPFHGGQAVRVVVAHEEVTERRLAEERLQRKVRHLAALRAIDSAITGSYDLGLTLTICLDQVVAELGVAAAAALVFDQHAQTLDYRAGSGFRGAGLAQASVRVGRGLAGRAALERRPVGADLQASPEPVPSLLRAVGVRYYLAVPLIARGQIKGALELFSHQPFSADEEWQGMQEALAGQVAIAIDSAALFEQLQRSNLELGLAYDETIEGWSRALDLRDQETEGHSQRVTQLTLRLARAAGIGGEELVHIRRGALLHDIGKMGIPDAILLKPGPLTEAEWAVMRRHPQLARDWLVRIAYLRPALDIPWCHHERWDGGGYPRGLRGDEIPLAARLFAAIDVWDALCSDRPYRAAWARERARAHIIDLAGSHFDPWAVELFLREIAPQA